MAIVGSKTYVTINGVDVSDYVLSWKATESLDMIVDIAELLLSGDVVNILSISNEQVVIIKRGKSTGQESLIFSGFIKLHSPKGATIEVEVESKLGLLGRRQVTKTYDKDIDPQGGVLSSIAEDIISNYGGLRVSVVDSSGVSRPLQIYNCNRDVCLERVERLREVLDWVLRYDYEADQAVFEPKGNTTHSMVLRYNTVGSSNVENVPKWEFDSDGMVNKVEVIGRPLEDVRTETFSGDGVTTTFTLSETPLYTEVSIGGARQVLGVEGSTSDYDYTVKQHSREVIFRSAPASGSNNVSVTYGVYRPISIILEDSDSIDAYSPTDPVTGEKLPFEKSFKFDDVVTMEDAEKRAEEILSHLSQPLKSTIVEVEHPVSTIRAGMSIRFIDEINGIDDYFIVKEVVHQWPEPVDIVSIGQERVFQKNTLVGIEDRLKKLEKRELSNIDLVTIRKDGIGELRVFGYEKTYVRDVTYDGAWGKGFGDGGSSMASLAWGESGAVWQDSYSHSPSLVSVVWPNNTAEIDFCDDDLIDTINSTATINTSNCSVTFGTPAETLILGPLHKGISGTDSSPSVISSVTIRVPSDCLTGSFDSVDVSSDGNNWEGVSGDVTSINGAVHSFGTPGSSVFVRFTAANASLSGLDGDGKIRTVVYCWVVD